MKTINEASTLSALGINDKDISELHTLRRQLPHDMEYVPVKSKSEASAYIKQKYLLVGKNSEGLSAGILYFREYPHSSYEVVVGGKTHHVGSLKDALAFLRGKATWYRSVKPVKSPRGSEFQKNESEMHEFIYNVVDRIERIYGKKLRDEARKYMKEVRNAIGSAVTQDKRKKITYMDTTAEDNLASLKKAYDKLEEVAKSKTPFNALATVLRDRWRSNRHGFAGFIANEVGEYHYDRHEPAKAGRWAKENPAAVAKIVRFALSNLRSIRDDAFDNYHKKKDSIETEPYRLRVREAYEHFLKSGEIVSITKEKK
jgi:hypothetical protein